jgi:nicotinamide phosphoribosyltransferase
MKMNPILAIDGYKVSHRAQYPQGTTQVYSNFTPRSDRFLLSRGGR